MNNIADMHADSATRTRVPWRSPSPVLLALLCAGTCLSASALLAQAPGQSKGPMANLSFGSSPDNRPVSADRIVEGRVLNDKGEAVKNASVSLVSLQGTKGVKTVLTNASGVYRFVEVPRNFDYKLWAEADKKKSTEKTISSFDARNAFTIDLKIDKVEAAQARPPAETVKK